VTESDETADDAFLKRLLHQVRPAQPVTLHDLRKLTRARIALRAQGLSVQDPRAALWLAPVFCNSAAEQNLFHHHHGELTRKVPAYLSGAVKPAAGLGMSVFMNPSRPVRAWMLASFAGGGIASALFVWLNPGGTNLSPEPGAAPVIIQRLSPIWAGSELTGLAAPRINYLLGMTVVLGLFAGLALVLLIGLKALRLRGVDADPDRSRRHFQDIDTGLFSGERFRSAFAAMRQPVPVPGQRLAVAQSIQATLAAGGFPTIVQADERRSPHYSLLIDAESPRDHLAALARHFVAAARGESLELSPLRYFSQPDYLQPADAGKNVAPVSRQARATLTADSTHRWLLLTEPDDCVQHFQPADWLGSLGPNISFLNPRPSSRWGREELVLAESGIATIDLAPLRQVHDTELSRAVADRHSRPDLSSRLRSFDDRWTDETAPPRWVVDELLIDLEVDLESSTFRWLRCLAIFPSLEPSLTLLIGAALSMCEGRPNPTEEQVVAVARLPWLRRGQMPAWLRKRLVHGLDDDAVQISADAIRQYLTSTDGSGHLPEEALGRSSSRRARRKIVAWLRHHREANLTDLILIDALMGISANELGDTLPRHRSAARSARENMAAWIPAALLACILPTLLSMNGYFEEPLGVQSHPNILSDLLGIQKPAPPRAAQPQPRPQSQSPIVPPPSQQAAATPTTRPQTAPPLAQQASAGSTAPPANGEEAQPGPVPLSSTPSEEAQKLPLSPPISMDTTTRDPATRAGIKAEILRELNLLRVSPDLYADRLDPYRTFFKGNLVRYPGQSFDIVTHDGVSAVQEALNFLRSQPSVPALTISPALERVSQALVDDQAQGGTGHQTSDGADPSSLSKRFGGEGMVSQVIAYGSLDAADVVRQLIVDDGVQDRGHRRIMVAPELRFVGVACGPHPEYRTVCAITMAMTPRG